MRRSCVVPICIEPEILRERDGAKIEGLYVCRTIITGFSKVRRDDHLYIFYTLVQDAERCPEHRRVTQQPLP